MVKGTNEEPRVKGLRYTPTVGKKYSYLFKPYYQ